MNAFYPAFLDLRRRTVLVVGGGEVALQKIKTLLPCGADLVVVSPSALVRIKKLAAQKKVKYVSREFKVADLRGKHVVVCATDDEALNRRVGLECAKRNILVNVVDRPKLCSFIVPAVVRRGEAIFAVSTGGASPALAKFLRRKLERRFGREIAVLSRKLMQWRDKILAIPMDRRRKVLKRVINDRSIERIMKGDSARLFKKLENILDRSRPKLNFSVQGAFLEKGGSIHGNF